MAMLTLATSAPIGTSSAPRTPRPPRASPWHPLPPHPVAPSALPPHPVAPHPVAPSAGARAARSQLHCVYDNTASDRPSGYGSDETGEMCNQYLLSDLRLQTRGSKGGAVLGPSGAVLAALEPPRPRATQRRGALGLRWGSGTEVGLWAAPPRPGSAFRAPRGPTGRGRGGTIGLGAKSADPAATDHEQADALRPGRAAAQPHVRGLAARGGRRPRHRPAAPPGREANHVAAR